MSRTTKKWLCMVIPFLSLLLVVLLITVAYNRITEVEIVIQNPTKEELEAEKALPYKSPTPTWQCSNIPITETNVDTSKVKVMCLIFTAIKYWDTKARAVRETWARKCDKVWFIYSTHSDQPPLPYPAVGFNVEDSKHRLTRKVMEAMELAYRNHSHEIDWFLKADDDTFVVMENLKLLLSPYQASKPHYIGRLFPRELDHGFNSGGAGYVLSKKAVSLISADKSKPFTACTWMSGLVEDLDMGKCMEAHGVYPTKSTDELCRLRFHSENPKTTLLPKDGSNDYFYKKNDFILGHPNGERILSPFTVTFHHLQPAEIYLYDFFINDFRKAKT